MVDPARVLVGSPTLIRLFAHEYAEGLDRLTFGSARVDTAVYFLAKAELGQRRNQTQLAREYYDSARVVLEGRVRERPEQFWDPLRDHPRFQALLEKYE